MTPAEFVFARDCEFTESAERMPYYSDSVEQDITRSDMVDWIRYFRYEEINVEKVKKKA